MHRSVRIAFLLVLCLACDNARGSQTICMFEGPEGAPVRSLEFIGYGEIAALQLNSPSIAASFPDGSWKVRDFDQHASRIHLVYTNPGDPRLPPSFVLRGEGAHTRLTTARGTFIGRFSCGLW